MTDDTAIPRRSFLFVPAAKERALAKAAASGADGLIYDLEDSAAPGEKEAARERLRAHLKADMAPGERLVRINTLDTAWGTEDLLMARGAGVDGVVVPKVSTPADVAAVADALDETDAPAGFGIWAMIESARAILELKDIALQGREHRLKGLIVGPNDLALETGIEPGPERAELLPWLMQTVAVARAAEIAVLDGVFADFRDEAGFAAECAAGRRMGFDGKTLIHPAQVEPANAAFAPSEAAVTQARAIVAAFEQPENRDKGVISLEGRMVERLHENQARRLIARADAIAARKAER